MRSDSPSRHLQYVGPVPDSTQQLEASHDSARSDPREFLDVDRSATGDDSHPVNMDGRPEVSQHGLRVCGNLEGDRSCSGHAPPDVGAPQPALEDLPHKEEAERDVETPTTGYRAGAGEGRTWAVRHDSCKSLPAGYDSRGQELHRSAPQLGPWWHTKGRQPRCHSVSPRRRAACSFDKIEPLEAGPFPVEDSAQLSATELVRSEEQKKTEDHDELRKLRSELSSVRAQLCVKAQLATALERLLTDEVQRFSDAEARAAAAEQHSDAQARRFQQELDAKEREVAELQRRGYHRVANGEQRQVRDPSRSHDAIVYSARGCDEDVAGVPPASDSDVAVAGDLKEMYQAPWDAPWEVVASWAARTKAEKQMARTSRVSRFRPLCRRIFSPASRAFLSY